MPIPLGTLVGDWKKLLTDWGESGALARAAREALMLEGEPEPLKRLVNQWREGDFSGLPPIVLLPASSMPGAAGAYAISTGTIYLNQDWLAGATEAQPMAVITEELGHHLDGLLNAVDTPGDEGELFARLLAGEKLSAADLLALRTQTDQTQLLINDQYTAAEAAIDLTPPRPGGDNPEILTGTSGDDLIDGFGGDDTITGLAGDDVLMGGSGNDVIYGGSSTAANTDTNEVDTVILTGNASDYTIFRATDSVFGYAYYIQDNRAGPTGGLDTLYDIDLT